jgi:hypothetical protein
MSDYQLVVFMSMTMLLVIYEWSGARRSVRAATASTSR